MSLYPLKNFGLIMHTLSFIGKCFPVLFVLCLVAAFGRSLQLGAAGELNATFNFLLEIILQASRVVVFIITLGEGSIVNGYNRVRRLFSSGKYRHELLVVKHAVILNFRENKKSILLNFIAFVIIAVVLNYVIHSVAYDTGLLSSLKQTGLIAEQSSEWVMLLFFKNLSVIPFTIIFETIFFCWLTGKLVQQPVSFLKFSNQ